ncbi:hypothetical protein [Pseudoalteromonas xiamenensis]
MKKYADQKSGSTEMSIMSYQVQIESTLNNLSCRFDLRYSTSYRA